MLDAKHANYITSPSEPSLCSPLEVCLSWPPHPAQCSRRVFSDRTSPWSNICSTQTLNRYGSQKYSSQIAGFPPVNGGEDNLKQKQAELSKIDRYSICEYYLFLGRF